MPLPHATMVEAATARRGTSKTKSTFMTSFLLFAVAVLALLLVQSLIFFHYNNNPQQPPPSDDSGGSASHNHSPANSASGLLAGAKNVRSGGSATTSTVTPVLPIVPLPQSVRYSHRPTDHLTVSPYYSFRMKEKELWHDTDFLKESGLEGVTKYPIWRKDLQIEEDGTTICGKWSTGICFSRRLVLLGATSCFMEQDD